MIFAWCSHPYVEQPPLCSCHPGSTGLLTSSWAPALDLHQETKTVTLVFVLAWTEFPWPLALLPECLSPARTCEVHVRPGAAPAAGFEPLLPWPRVVGMFD